VLNYLTHSVIQMTTETNTWTDSEWCHPSWYVLYIYFCDRNGKNIRNDPYYYAKSICTFISSL